MGLSLTVSNQLKQTEDKLDKNRIRKRDKADRATVDDCLDDRTMTVMDKLLENEKLSEFGGCIATGKEANVYVGHGSWDFETRQPFEADEDFDIPVKDYAIKIFKTSVQSFKDRERYVAGEFRFRHGGYKKNPRRMIRMWAEKEVRNLKRIAQPGNEVKVPYPHYLKNNVIVMDFLGNEEGEAAPRLRDADVEDWTSAYEQTLLILRRLYQRCKLVHADLSEYNLLHHNGEVWVIDVSQAVEHDHPMSLDFLRRDCSTISDFFGRKLERVLTTKATFDFVTDISIAKDDEEQHMHNLLDDLSARTIEEYEDDLAQDAVFKEMYIPRTLQDVSIEDIVRMQRDGVEIAFDKLTGLKLGKEEAEDEEIKGSVKSKKESGSESDSKEADSGNEEDDEEIDVKKGVTICLDGMTKEEKKAHKKRVKEENREKRQSKVPKHEQKAKEKKYKRK